MKPTLLLFCLIIAAPGITAQETINFFAQLDERNAVPPGTREIRGSARLELLADQLSYQLTVDRIAAPVAGLYGPAAPGQAGELLYDLGMAYCTIAPPGQSGDYCEWFGDLAISSAQIPDLNNGLWYVEVHDRLTPAYATRGQIVPEPASWTLLLLAASATFLIRNRAVYRRQSRANRSSEAALKHLP